MKKKGFVFYASYYEAIQTLSVKNKLLAYEAITRYALYQDVMPNLPSRVLAILMVAMPTIDSNFEKYNKKVAKTQKGMSEFDEITNKKVDLPLKEEMFHLEALYQHHKPYVQELLLKKNLIYNDSYLAMMQATFANLNLSKQYLDIFLYGYSFDENLDRDKILEKLTKDILEKG